MKERVELEIKTINDAINSLGYLHIDEIKGEELLELIKDLWENQRIAIKALLRAGKAIIFVANHHNVLDVAAVELKVIEQALSTIRGK